MNRKIRIICLLCAALMLSCLFSSCKKEDSEAVFSYGNTTLGEKMFMYELSIAKTEFLSSFGVSEDKEELWRTSIGEGVTFDDYCYAQAQVNICATLFFADYAKEHGGTLTAEQNKTIDEQIDKLLGEFGSKRAFNLYLEQYGIDYDLYKEWLELSALYQNGLALAYAEGGERELSEEMLRDYYNDNFITVKHVAIGTDIAGQDQAGNYVYYTDDEKAEKQAKIDSIRAEIKNGADFDKLYLESEDKQAELYPDGYTITKGALEGDMSGYEQIALSLEIGEVGEFEKEQFGHYFIKRVELLDSDFENCINYIYPILVEQDIATAVIENYEGFTMNQEIIDSYNMVSVPMLK